MGENFNAMRFSKKVIVFTMGATIVYAVVYMVQEHKSSAENAKLEEPQLGDDADGVMHPNDMEE